MLAGQFPGPAGAVEGDEFRLARCLDTHAVLHQAGKLQAAVSSAVNRVALHVEAQEWGKVLRPLVVGPGHPNERTEVGHFVVFQKQEVQPGEALERGEVGNLVVAGGEGGQALERGDAVKLGDLIVVEIE